jgi:twitching motility protein PilJ
MPDERTKSSLLGILRRTARSAQASVGMRTATDENAVWQAHERALARARDASEAAQRIASSVTKQRGVIDTVADRMRGAGVRAQELTGGFGRVVDAFERLGLVALNAGLEAARLGEQNGRALLTVSEEIRAQTSRGLESTRELGVSLNEIASELLALHAQLGTVRQTTSEASQDAAQTSGASADIERALVELGERLRKATGSDPETVRAVAEATEHARALVAALGTLSGKVPRGLLIGTLRPVLEPLARLLLEEDEAEPSSEP